MAFTTHGHHISGTELDEAKRPSLVARCGGPGLCTFCSQQASIERNLQLGKATSVADNLGANPVPVNPMDLPLKARILVAEYANTHFEITDGTSVDVDDCYVVWFAFVLGSWKALVSTNLPDGKYYEVTYNKEKKETYIDVYVKFDNKAIPD